MSDNRKKTVVVGMSGGVDSSVAAYLLKEQGYHVVGVTMEIWRQEALEEEQAQGGCCGLSAVEDARRVARTLGIPHYVMNFREEFERSVIRYFVEEYKAGRTPNPCIACNRSVKWESLLHRSLAIGADYIATGHYARISRLENGRYALKKSAAGTKDQTYALYSLTQEQLSRTLMPLGGYTKAEIRQIARKAGLQVAAKPDSQEICFIPDHDYAAFIEKYLGKPDQEGNFVDLKGNVLGRHKGITHYTVGQRKGLGLSMGRPVFVLAIRPKTNEVVVGEEKDVFTNRICCSKLNWMAIEGISEFMPPFGGETFRVKAKIRYSHEGTACTLRPVGEDQMECLFDEPVRAATPGQAVVFYSGEYVLGGGIIL